MKPKAFFIKLHSALHTRLLNLGDMVLDLRICGKSLVKYVPSIFRDDENGVGGTGSQSTHYVFLKRIFSNVELLPSDVIIDVGCGKGRVLAFLIKEKCPCRLVGIEHNADVGAVAAEWTKRYANTEIIIGDAFKYDYSEGTVITLARSFLPKTFLSFIEHLERELKHPIKLVYWYDQQSGYLLKDRPGWKMIMREKVDRIHGLKISAWPQSYSVWIYSPVKEQTPET